MKVSEIIFIWESIQSAMDFIQSNTDGDQTGIGDEMSTELEKSKELLDKEKYRIYLNAAKRKLKNSKSPKPITHDSRRTS